MGYKIFTIVLLCLFLLNGAAFAQNSLFNVQDVEVDVTADNALAARELAFTQAQSDAFVKLVERLAIDDNAVSEKSVPDPITLAAMIKDYEVTQEKLSNVRYIGTYTFRFKENAVRKYLSQNEVVYADTQSDPLLILPFYQDSDGTQDLWSHKNEWKQAWDRNDTRGGLVPLRLPVGDLEDVRNIGDNEALNYEPVNLENLLTRYGAKEAVIAIAVPDAGFARDNGDGLARGTLKIDLYRTDYFKPQHVRQIFVTARGNQTRSQIFDQAAREIKKTLSANWKEEAVAQSNNVDERFGTELKAHVPIGSLADWMAIQAKLKSVKGVQRVDVESLAPKKVTVTLFYDGDLNLLNANMTQMGMSLMPLSAGGFNPLTGEMVAATEYEIRMNNAVAPASGTAHRSARPSGYQQSF